MVLFKFRIDVLLIAVFFGFLSISSTFAAPSGATTVSATNISTAQPDTADSEMAYAGNLTELVIIGLSTTQSWQGYYGNVSGAIRLADANNNVMYNWSLASPSGEIYASTNSTIQWSYLQCFNFSAAGTLASDTARAGATSFYGTNLTGLESRYNINFSDADGVNETFNLIGAGTHDNFVTGSLQFGEGECSNLRVFDNTGQGVSNKFEEVLLYEPVTTSVVFASILEQDNSGFNGRTNDFEMLVLEDGHNADSTAVPYYFFVELQ